MVLSYCSDSVFFIKAGTATTIATALTLGKDVNDIQQQKKVVVFIYCRKLAVV